MTKPNNDLEAPENSGTGDTSESGTDSEGTTWADKTTELINRVREKGSTRSVADELEATAKSPEGTQLDLFVTQILDANYKDDLSTMGAPFFSLATRPDMEVWRWESADKKKWLEVIPSGKGRATMHDKDFLIYVTSVMVAAMEAALRNQSPMPSRRITVTLHDYFVKTGKSTSGVSYERIEDTLDRLRGTSIKTNIARAAGVDHRTGFGMIDKYEYDVHHTPGGDKFFRGLEVTLSEWLYEAIKQREVLTINSDYFALRKPLEKRLYELARKHIGTKDTWVVNDDTLHKATGSGATLRRFRSMMSDIVEDDRLPDYKIMVGASKTGDVQYTFNSRTSRNFKLGGTGASGIRSRKKK